MCAAITDDYILDLADKAARCVLKGRPCWTAEDWEDAIQEAAIGILEAHHRDGITGEGYLFNAGRNQIYEWMRTWLRYRRRGTLLDYIDYLTDDDTGSIRIDRDKIASLAPMLERARIKVQPNTRDKVQQEIRFLQLLMEGYSFAGIAMELGITERTARGVRERLLPVLQSIADGAERTMKPWTPGERQLENLRRINSDPELRRQRGLKIREGLAKRKAAQHVQQ